MKRRRKRRKAVLQPQVTLIGNSGKICRDNRLCRLRMTKKYKTFLMEQEYEKRTKVLCMSRYSVPSPDWDFSVADYIEYHA